MRCVNCHYKLDHLEKPVCPECGQPFDPDDVTSFLPDFEPRDKLGDSILGWAVLIAAAIAVLSIYGVVQAIGWHR